MIAEGPCYPERVKLHSRDDRLPAAWIVDDSPLELERARRALDGDYRVTAFDDANRFLVLAQRGGFCELRPV